jgi:hypothetical protein
MSAISLLLRLPKVLVIALANAVVLMMNFSSARLRRW